VGGVKPDSVIPLLRSLLYSSHYVGTAAAGILAGFGLSLFAHPPTPSGGREMGSIQFRRGYGFPVSRNKRGALAVQTRPIAARQRSDGEFGWGGISVKQ